MTHNPFAASTMMIAVFSTAAFAATALIAAQTMGLPVYSPVDQG